MPLHSKLFNCSCNENTQHSKIQCKHTHTHTRLAIIVSILPKFGAVFLTHFFCVDGKCRINTFFFILFYGISVWIFGTSFKLQMWNEREKKDQLAFIAFLCQNGEPTFSSNVSTLLWWMMVTCICCSMKWFDLILPLQRYRFNRGQI